MQHTRTSHTLLQICCEQVGKAVSACFTWYCNGAAQQGGPTRIAPGLLFSCLLQVQPSPTVHRVQHSRTLPCLLQGSRPSLVGPGGLTGLPIELAPI